MEEKARYTATEFPQEFFLKDLYPVHGKLEELPLEKLLAEMEKIFPLYRYSEGGTKRSPNLNMEIVSQMAKDLENGFVSEQEEEGNVCMANSEEVTDDFRLAFSPMDIAAYIFAVLFSSPYKDKDMCSMDVAELKIPYPTIETFWELVRQGRELRKNTKVL